MPQKKRNHFNTSTKIKSVLNKTAGSFVAMKTATLISTTTQHSSITGDSVDDHYNIHGVSSREFINFGGSVVCQLIFSGVCSMPRNMNRKVSGMYLGETDH